MFDFKNRVNRFRDEFSGCSIGSFLVTSESNVQYLSGFKGSDSVLLITPDAQFFLTDSRYTEEAKNTVKNFTIVEVTSSTYDTLGHIIKNNRVKDIGFESMNLPYEVVRRLKLYTGKAKLKPVKNVIERLRAIKDDGELKLIRAAVKAAKQVLGAIVKEVRPGVTERYLSDRIECAFIGKGARAGFQTIAAHGKNSAKPHAHPTDEKICKDDIVMLDMGCRLDSYNSDITRMVFLGSVKDKLKEIYAVVSRAHDLAIDAIRPGRKISEVDTAGRQYIAAKGFGRFFGHSLGHGVGLDVHEEPSVSGRNNDILRPGMVFTVEPAIYIPGMGGVRIEDMVLVTKNGCEILTR